MGPWGDETREGGEVAKRVVEEAADPWDLEIGRWRSFQTFLVGLAGSTDASDDEVETDL